MAPWISLALMILAGLGLVLRHDMLPVIGFDLGVASAAVAIAGLLVFSGRSEASMDEPARPVRNLHQPIIVSCLAALLFAAYTYSDVAIAFVTGKNTEPSSVANVRSGLPSRAQKNPRGRVALRLKRQADGLFSARARLNGSPTHLTVDTGAATLVLSAEDARRAGIDVKNLSFTVPVQTASGTVYAAPAQLERVFVGPLGAANVAALIAKPGRLDFSVLGMSFLKRLRSYEIQGNHLTLEG